MNGTSYVAKTKALISFANTAKLIYVFVFAYAKSRFSHDALFTLHLVIYTTSRQLLRNQKTMQKVRSEFKNGKLADKKSQCGKVSNFP